MDGTGLEAVYKRASGVVEGEIIRPILHDGGVEVNDLVLGLVATPAGVNSTNGEGFRSGGLRRRGSWRRRGEGSLGNVYTVVCLDSQSQRNDLSYMGFGAVDLDGNTERLAQQPHGLEAFLVVGAATTNVDFDLVIDERGLELLEGTDDTLEGSGDIGEVGNATTNDQDLSLGVGLSTCDEVEDSFGVFVGLTLGRRTGVFSVVCELVGKTVGGNRI